MGDDDNTDITLKALDGDDGKDKSDDDSMHERETHLCRLLDDGQAKLRVDGESGSEPSGDGVWGRLLHHAATLRPVAMETASSWKPHRHGNSIIHNEKNGNDKDQFYSASSYKGLRALQRIWWEKRGGWNNECKINVHYYITIIL